MLHGACHIPFAFFSLRRRHAPRLGGDASKEVGGLALNIVPVE